MEKSLFRAYIVELLGTFALIYLSAGAVCVNYMTTPHGAQAGVKAGEEPPAKTTPAAPAVSWVYGHQPGLVGIALAYGLAFAVLLSVTLHVSGGFLNPAITLMLWVFNRMNTSRMAWLIGAQLLGAVLAGLCLRLSFDNGVLEPARLGAPHMNLEAYKTIAQQTLLTGAAIEMALTFFVVFALFGTLVDDSTPRRVGLAGGLALIPCVLVAHPLTGSAINPARWFGTAFWERFSLTQPDGAPGALADVFVYMAGPIVGALLAGAVYFWFVYPVAQNMRLSAEGVPTPAPAPVAGGSTQVKAKK